MGKGEMRREAPVNAPVRQVLDEWLEHRATVAGAGERALWVQPDRLSAVGTLRRPGRPDGRCWQGLSCRRTPCAIPCLTGLGARGNDLVMVAELAGHQKLETTRRYTLSSRG
jgi:site-specific recombinase XerC